MFVASVQHLWEALQASFLRGSPQVAIECRDLDADALAQGRALAAARGLRNLSYIQHDALDPASLCAILPADVVVVSGWSTFAAQAAVAWCRARRVPYVLHVESHDLEDLLTVLAGLPSLRAEVDRGGSGVARAVRDQGYAWFAEWLRSKVKSGDAAEHDADAVATLFLGALSNYWQTSALGVPAPIEVDDQRFIETWVDTLLAYLRAGAKTRTRGES